MSKGPISKKQEIILEYLKQVILERGYPPSVREICEAVNLKSTSSVHSHLEALEKNGYIKKDATKPRAIEILDDDFSGGPAPPFSGSGGSFPRGLSGTGQYSGHRPCSCRAAASGGGTDRILLSVSGG